MDIRGGVDGVVIDLDLQVVEQGTCAPIQGVEVDVWGADAVGDYSGYAQFDTEGEDFMRGQQLTDSDGIARFTAIVPGSYPGRAVHLHVKVRAPGVPELTTQVYLPDGLVGEILADERYSDGAEQTRNRDDNFYAPDTLLVASGSVADGVTAEGVLVV
ncbi:MAG: protocatechuate 3,4-dioxygenase beta subunit [Myxococcota bacterium]|jgi:protocatechuate 3,4-dioxygenase beta subunit